MIAWKAVACYESNRTFGEAALDGCLFPINNRLPEPHGMRRAGVLYMGRMAR